MRLVCTQLFGVLFASWSSEDLNTAASKHQGNNSTQVETPTGQKKKKKLIKKADENGATDTHTSEPADSGDYLLKNLDLKVSKFSCIQNA